MIKKILPSFIVLSMFSMSCYAYSSSPKNDALDSSKKDKRIVILLDFIKEFEQPSKTYRPKPLWSWNDNTTHAEIDNMLEEFKEQGFGGTFIHPRVGMYNEYFSKEWFELWTYALVRSKKLGMDLWIYDENSFPSGFAGGTCAGADA